MTIPKKLRQQCWENIFSKVYSHKCYVPWCTTVIDVWTFEVGHNVAEKNGGTLDLSNLFPICSLCNKSMGTTSIDDWSKLNGGSLNGGSENGGSLNSKEKKHKCYTNFSCFSRK